MTWNIDLPKTMYFGPGYTTCPYTGERFDTIMRELLDAQHIALDTETTGLVKWRDVPLFGSMAWGSNRRMTFSAYMLPYFQELFANPNKEWLFANAKYDNHMLANVGMTITGNWCDVQVMHMLMYEDKPHKLKFIADHILGWKWASFEDQFGKIGKSQSARALLERAAEQDFNLLVEYAANDAWGTLQAYWKLREQLETCWTHSLFQDKPPYINTLWDYFTKIEVPFIKVLWKMERRGIMVDAARLEKAHPEAEAEIHRLEKEIWKLRGAPININSPDQMRTWLIDEVGLEALKMTKGGKTGVRKASVDADFLEHHKYSYPGCELALSYREYTKLDGTYLVGLHEVLDPYGRIHTNFNMDIARTGRLSSSDPNLQNIPRPENDKWGLREAFITFPGWKILAADYEQLEMRLLAAAAMEQPMIDIFIRGWDIHQGNASMMFDIPYEHIEVCRNVIDKGLKKGKISQSDVIQVLQQEMLSAVDVIQNRFGLTVDGAMAYVRECLKARSDAKNIGFGLNYGMGPGKLARQINARTIEEAKHKIQVYKEKYPAVDRFFKEAVEEGRKYGYSFTVLGRRRNIPMIASTRKDQQALGERLAVNTQIQGSAADVTKMAQLNIEAMGFDRMYDFHMLLQVHDELVFEGPEEVMHEVQPQVEELMAHPFCMDLSCPMAAAAGIGDSWGQAK